MVCSCFCWKRSFGKVDRTPLIEYDKNRREVNQVDARLTRLLRSLEQLHGSWVRLAESSQAFGKDAPQGVSESDGDDLKRLADKVQQLAESLRAELRQPQAGQGDAPSARLLRHIKEFKKRLKECKARSAKLERLAKDYDARRAVVDDKEKANATDKALTRVRDLMYAAESKFRDAESDVLTRQAFLLRHASTMLQACLVCYVAMQNERITLLTDKAGEYRKLQESYSKGVLQAIDRDVFPTAVQES